MSIASLLLVAIIAQAAPLPAEKPEPPLSHACERLHEERQKCEVGQKSCSQRRVDYWLARCQRSFDERSAEPHGE